MTCNYVTYWKALYCHCLTPLSRPLSEPLPILLTLLKSLTRCLMMAVGKNMQEKIRAAYIVVKESVPRPSSYKNKKKNFFFFSFFLFSSFFFFSFFFFLLSFPFFFFLFLFSFLFFLFRLFQLITYINSHQTQITNLHKKQIKKMLIFIDIF